METRNGHTLYLVIDYDKPLDEDCEQYETYFLNLVDESDLLALAGGGALYWFKLRKSKADTKGPAVLDDYDFGEADDDTEYETEEDESDAPSDSVGD